jgi:hypothetical protein
VLPHVGHATGETLILGLAQLDRMTSLHGVHRAVCIAVLDLVASELGL